MTSRLLTLPIIPDQKPEDPAMAWAINHERLMREIRYRFSENWDLQEFTLTEIVPARDAGDVCHVCGELVTWVDHLPPIPFTDEPVRCRKNVREFPLIIDDIFPRV